MGHPQVSLSLRSYGSAVKCDGEWGEETVPSTEAEAACSFIFPRHLFIRSVYFYGHILMIGTMILGKVFPPPRKARQQPPSQGQNGSGTHKGAAAGAGALEGAKEGEGEAGKKEK